MIAPSRGLLLRIYVVSMAQLLLVAGVITLTGWLLFKFDPNSPFMNEARYTVAQLAERAHEPALLQRELERVAQLTGAHVSVYGAHGRLLGSNVTPALDRLQQQEAHGPPPGMFGSGPDEPPVHVFPLDAADPRRGYAVYSRGRPPRPPATPALWALGAALIGAALATVVLARSFVSPLSELASAAEKLGAGDLSARVRSGRKDEFGQLAQTFDDMADRLTQVLRSQQELLANVSHELRTPLARIRVAIDIASEGDASAAQEALGEITEDLGELERLVSDVLQTAKLDLAAGRAGGALPRLRNTAVDVRALAETAAQRFRSAYPGRTLQLELGDALPTLQADQVLLRRAIDNLLANARAYSDDDAAITLRVHASEAQLEIEVVDRGIGIAAEDLLNVSKPFFRTDKSRARRTGGLGLGLSLSRRIVEAHAGELAIASELGKGTTVRITLPA
ncbi:MAG TPA: HAMP domain-containing sensor histidine kinase [Polyangiales bacterium]|nr:HAMP domain-containing sensor histidine kinase [Polyangiales bacterium]